MQVIRPLLRAPAFAVNVVVTLGVAIGAALTAYTLVDRVMLRPLPLRSPDEILVVTEDDTRGNQRLASYPTFEDWRQTSRSFSDMVFFRGGTANLGPRGERMAIILGLASPGYGHALGVTPILGRTFTAEEEAANGPHVAMIMESVWTNRFGRDRSVIGQVILINDRPTTVIGVVPESQRYPEWAEVLVPMEPLRVLDPALGNRLLHVDSRVIGRLAAGADRDRASRELSNIQRELVGRFPDPAGAFPGVQLVPLRDSVVGTIGGPLTALAWAMGLVLVLASANVAGLALLRAARRSREFGVKAAMGASSRVLVGEVFLEWVVLAAGAGVIGTAVAAGLVGVVRATPSLGIPRSAELSLDWPLVLAGLVGAQLLGLGIGALPAWRAGQWSPTSLRFGRGSAASGADARWLRAAVATVQMALATMLLAGAGLFLRSFSRMQTVNIGYAPSAVYAIDVNPPRGRYDDEVAARSLYRRLVDAAARVPGIEASAFINHVPLGGAISTRVSVPGVAPDPNGLDQALYKTASEGYASAVGLRVVRGRWFTREEVDAVGSGVVISESVANQFWPGENPIGRTLTVYRSSQARAGFGSPEPSTVLGVVSDVRHFGPTQPGSREVYLPFTREAWGWGSLVVRTRLNEADVRRALEGVLRTTEPELSVGGVGGQGFRVLRTDLERFFAPRRLAVLLATGLAALALLVAMLGLYALSAYAVAMRTGEFGVRMAIGASPERVRREVFLGGARLVALGTALGVAGALALGRLVAALLYDTSSRDPLVLATAVGTLAVALCASLAVPARRASRLSPTEALRVE